MKPIHWLFSSVFLFGIGSTSLFGEEKKLTIEIKKVTPEDSDILEEWVRVTSEEDLLGVDAARLKQAKWNWQVSISVAEFVRKEPLASALEDKITSALKGVKGVKMVAREDREVWLVQGEVGGEELVWNCSIALEKMAPELRKYMKSL